jgi:hypothetical protein
MSTDKTVHTVCVAFDTTASSEILLRASIRQYKHAPTHYLHRGEWYSVPHRSVLLRCAGPTACCYGPDLFKSLARTLSSIVRVNQQQTAQDAHRHVVCFTPDEVCGSCKPPASADGLTSVRGRLGIMQTQSVARWALRQVWTESKSLMPFYSPKACFCRSYSDGADGYGRCAQRLS